MPLNVVLEKGVAVYSPQHTKKQLDNEYTQELNKLADLKDEKASLLFENDDLKKFKYAANSLKEKGVYFTFRKDKEKPTTHHRVWWIQEQPKRVSKKAEASNAQN